MMQQGLNVNLPQSRRAPPMPAQSDPIYVTVPVSFGRNRVVQIGNESIRLDVLARAHPPARPAARRQASVPAQRRPGDDAADHGRDGSPEGRRRREGRHRVAAADRRPVSLAAMAMTSDLVSSTIVARAREPDGLRRMMIVSAVAHSVAIVALVFVPWLFGTASSRGKRSWRSASSGAPGRDSGGMTAISARAVQKVEPKAELPKPTRRRRRRRRRRRWSSRPPSRRRPKPSQKQPSTVDEGGAAVDRRDGAPRPVEGGNGIDVE